MKKKIQETMKNVEEIEAVNTEASAFMVKDPKTLNPTFTIMLLIVGFCSIFAHVFWTCHHQAQSYIFQTVKKILQSHRR